MLAWILLTLSPYSSLSSIAPSRSSKLHPVFAQRYYREVLAGRPTLARLCEGIGRRTSLMSSSLLLHQCPACLVHLILKVLEMGGRWSYSCCFMGCCFQDLSCIVRSNLMQLLSSFFFIRFVRVIINIYIYIYIYIYHVFLLYFLSGYFK